MKKSVCAIMFALLLPGLSYSQETSVKLVCPGSPEITESMFNVDPQWEAVRDEGKRGIHLMAVSLYLGHPSKMGALVPDKVTAKDKKRHTIWNLPSGSADPYWVSCGYSNTLLMLAKKLPESAKRCEVKEALLPNGKMLSIDSIHCE